MSRISWKLALVGICFLLSGSPGCERCGGREKPPTPQARVDELPKPPVMLGRWRLPAAERVVAVGDLHGDFHAARRALRLAGAVDKDDHWIGGSLVVVQLGDLLDRGDSEKALLAWLPEIQKSARAQGGALYIIIGNHEMMNAMGDFRYVSKRGFEDYGSENQEGTGWPLDSVPEFAQGRSQAFSPGSSYARYLAEVPVVMVVGDTVFVHGGLLPRHLRYGLDRMNREVAAYLRGETPLAEELRREDAPFWDRTFGDRVEPEDCRLLERMLVSLNVKRMVVGHTRQKDGITFACDRQVARVDVDLSSFYGHRAAQVLEIASGQLKVLTELPQPSP